MTGGGDQPRIVSPWREATPGVCRAAHHSVLVRRRRTAAECHDSGPAEESGQSVPMRSGMLKSCGCDAKTGAGRSFSGWSRESRERNGLGRSASGRRAPLGKTGRNSAYAIKPHGGLLITSHWPLSASAKLDGASIEWIVDRHKGRNLSDCVRATLQQQLFKSHDSREKPVSHHRSKKDKSWKGQYAMFEHLCLKHWPFVVVPEPGFCNFIADREQFRKDIDTLLRNLSRQNASSIHPIWSWFGAGKTHTL